VGDSELGAFDFFGDGEEFVDGEAVADGVGFFFPFREAEARGGEGGDVEGVWSVVAGSVSISETGLGVFLPWLGGRGLHV